MNIRKNTSYSSNQVFTLLTENIDILILLFWLNGRAFLLLSQIYHKHLEWYAYMCFKNNSREIFKKETIILFTNLLAYYVLKKTEKNSVSFTYCLSCSFQPFLESIHGKNKPMNQELTGESFEFIFWVSASLPDHQNKEASRKLKN